MVLQTEADVFWYLPENLSDQQQKSLAEFRQHLIGNGKLLKGHDDDYTLLRFLKARQWHVEPAALMYSNMVKWRQECKADEIYSTLDFPELPKLVAHYPHFYHKQDKFGRPVYIEMLGSIDCTKMLTVASQEHILQYHIWTWERLEQQIMPAVSQLEGKPIRTCTVILDLSGLSMKNFTLTTKRLMHAVTKIDQDYYPEHLGTMFIINTPYIFSAIWSCVTPLLEERTRKKITVLGSDYHSKLAQVIPLENLPTIYGGKSVLKDHYHTEAAWMNVEPCASSAWFPVGKQPEGGVVNKLIEGTKSLSILDGGADLSDPSGTDDVGSIKDLAGDSISSGSKDNIAASIITSTQSIAAST